LTTLNHNSDPWISGNRPDSRGLALYINRDAEEAALRIAMPRSAA
jgi:hypothetical protein